MIKQYIDEMDTMLDGFLEMDMADIAKYKGMVIFRDALIVEGFDPHDANLIACKSTVDVDSRYIVNYIEDITRHLGKMAKAMRKLFDVMSVEFNMDIETFIDVCGKQLEYKFG